MWLVSNLNRTLIHLFQPTVMGQLQIIRENKWHKTKRGLPLICDNPP